MLADKVLTTPNYISLLVESNNSPRLTRLPVYHSEWAHFLFLEYEGQTSEGATRSPLH